MSLTIDTADMARIRVIDETLRLDAAMKTVTGVSDCYVQASTPGMRAYIFGTGTTALDIIAEQMTEPGVLDTVSRQLLDTTAAFKTLKDIFPGRDGVITPGTKVFSASILSERISKSIKSADTAQSQVVCLIIAEMLMTALADLEIALPESGYVQMVTRMDGTPTYESLEREITRASILSALERVSLTVDKKRVTRVTLTVLEQVLTPILLGLGRELRRVKSHLTYFRDTMYYAKQTILYTLNEDNIERLSDTVLEDENLQFITGNFTLMRIALDSPNRVPTTASFELPRAFEATVLALRSSPRYRVKSLREFADAFGHTTLDNYLGQPKVLIFYKNLISEVRTQVTEFIEVPALGGVAQVQIPLENLERYLDRVLADAHQGLNFMAAKDRLTLACSLVIDQVETPMMLSLGTSDSELEHYVAAQCDRMILIRKEDMTYTMQYATSIDRKPHVTSSPVFNGLMHASDPAEFLLVKADKEAQLAIEIGVQSIPDECRKRKLITPVSKFTNALGRINRLSIEVAGEKISCDINFQELLGFEYADNVRVTVPPANRIIASSVVGGLQLASSLMRPGTEDLLFDEKTHQIYIGTMILEMLRPIFDTPAASELCRSIIDRLMNQPNLSATARRALRIHQYHNVVTMQIQVWLSLVLLLKVGYLGHQEAKWVMDYLEKNSMYSIMANTMTVK